MMMDGQGRKEYKTVAREGSDDPGFCVVAWCLRLVDMIDHVRARSWWLEQRIEREIRKNERNSGIDDQKRVNGFCSMRERERE